jgi:deoxyribodipyrimidine photo-lyase
MCPIDHSVRPAVGFRGGRKEGEKRLRQFLKAKLSRYDSERNEPSAHATSDLSPYLHFGQISSLETALQVHDYAAQHKLLPEAYLEELIVRRELAFNYCRSVADPAALANLPEWAQETMRQHARDNRSTVYTSEELLTARTHDDLWNATQQEMLLRGKIHGYYRMYWGKKILEWSPTYESAVKIMIDIHGHYALDGRDPNTFTNVLWCFGLHDRPWPERPIFGKIRYMSLEGMRRKTDTQAYIDEIARLKRKQKPS